MQGDFTRDTFDPSQHFSRVLMQQGRVQVDADWNEQTSILLHYLRTLAKDILGPYAGPASDLGFEIITKGMFVGPALDTKLAAIEPDASRRAALKTALDNGNLIIGPGRYYVEGVLVENRGAVLYTEQPGYPFNDETKPDALKNWPRRLLVYLDVWERHITYVEDDHIRDVALRGPDTCTRAQVVAQVKVLLEPTVTPLDAGDPLAVGGSARLRGRIFDDTENLFDCKAAADMAPFGSGRLRARARLDKPPTELCVIPPESRYRGPENQLYRVEVHRGGEATTEKTGATFKWSRENGSVTFPIRSLSGGTAMLEHLGRDLHLSLKPGDWVEVIDDVIAVGEQAGSLAQVDTVDRDELSVSLKLPDGASPLPSYGEADMATKHPLLRRWDHAGALSDKDLGGALRIREQANTDAGLKTGWIDLEDGVQIWFAQGGQYLPGDYWLVPARIATGDVDWPDELGADGKPRLDADDNPIGAALEPHGPRHYFAPLLLITVTNAPRVPGGPNVITRRAKDCRCTVTHLPCGYLDAFAGRAIGPDF